MHFALQAARNGQSFRAADDVRISPTCVPDLVNASLDLLLDDAWGIWHVTNHGICAWAGLARLTAQHAGLLPDLVVPRLIADFGLAARAGQSVLTSERSMVLLLLEHALGCCLADMERHPIASS